MLSKNFKIFNLRVLDKISLYIECISTTFFLLHILFSSYSPIKIYRIDMDHPVDHFLHYSDSAKLSDNLESYLMYIHMYIMDFNILINIFSQIFTTPTQMWHEFDWFTWRAPKGSMASISRKTSLKINRSCSFYRCWTLRGIFFLND